MEFAASRRIKKAIKLWNFKWTWISRWYKNKRRVIST